MVKVGVKDKYGYKAVEALWKGDIVLLSKK